LIFFAYEKNFGLSEKKKFFLSKTVRNGLNELDTCCGHEIRILILFVYEKNSGT